MPTWVKLEGTPNTYQKIPRDDVPPVSCHFDGSKVLVGTKYMDGIAICSDYEHRLVFGSPNTR